MEFDDDPGRKVFYKVLLGILGFLYIAIMAVYFSGAVK